LARHKNVLFIAAHQDDECAMSTRISREVEAGHTVHCAFLTDGSGGASTPQVRDEESRRVLSKLGVPEANIHLVGTRAGITGESLPHQMALALEELEAAVRELPIRRVYTLAYEGGHQDHDACHLVALVFAARCGLSRCTWQMPLYNGYRTPWKLFRMHKTLPGPQRSYQRTLPLREGLRHALLCLQFRSQWRSWIGLFPEHLLQRGLLRRERLQTTSLTALLERPHSGRLLYERIFGFSYETFYEEAESFLRPEGITEPRQRDGGAER
jgi:hypothetical protein